MRNKPPYVLDSVDNALRLIQMLRDQGKLRVSEAADELGIARSTAHRLLATLVYRGFAEQDEQRGYLPGPSLAMPLGADLQRLRVLAYPAMDRLCERGGETVNLMVRVGTQTRFLSSVESTAVLHVGDRRGTILPAARTSGGKALLAELAPEELIALYRGAEQDDGGGKLADDLKAIRGRGYALNVEDTEAGICAIGMALHDPAGHAHAALTIAMPSTRYSQPRVRALVPELRSAVEATERALIRDRA